MTCMQETLLIWQTSCSSQIYVTLEVKTAVFLPQAVPLALVHLLD